MNPVQIFIGGILVVTLVLAIAVYVLIRRTDE